jgi:serine/threonine protein kinase/Tfp pilus assembly protein PilF
MIMLVSQVSSTHETENGAHDATLGRLVDELTGKLQAGHAVDLKAYIDAYPEHAKELAQMFGAVQRLAELGAADADAPVERSGGVARPVESAFGSRLGELGDFHLLREVGRGGMGIVYEAEQVSLHRKVALKVLPLAAALDSKQLQRFQIEAQAAACLHHTHIVPVHAVGCERGVHYYAMQFIEGRSLAELIKELRRLEGLEDADPARSGADRHSAPRGSTTVAGDDNCRAELHSAPGGGRGPTPGSTRAFFGTGSASGTSTRNRDYIRTVAQFGVQVAEALDHAHERGILHRDIKPGNLLLDDLGQLWVADFGLAQIQDNPGLTLTGDILGTLRYMSPEQALAKRVVIDGRTDIYSLGVTLYELLTLRPAVDGADRREILRKIAEEEPAPLRKQNPAVPGDLETILMKAAAKEPGARYATAKDMADDLRRFLEDKPVLARRPGPLDRAAKWGRRHHSVVATGAAGLLVAAVIAAAATGWIVRDRTARLALIDREVERALDEAALFQAQANWPEALEVAKRAEGILAAGGSPDLRRRVGELRKDVEMVLRLEEIWMPRGRRAGESDLYNPGRASAYASAFREYGIDVEALEPSKAAARIRARTIRLELALALDFWALVLRDANRSPDAAEGRLLAVARAADPDPWRNQIRTAFGRRDFERLKELAASAHFSEIPLRTLSLLASSPLDPEIRLSLLRQAQQAHPDNFLISFQLGWALMHEWGTPYKRVDEVIRFYTAALAVRPRSAATSHWLADALGHAGKVEEQIAFSRKAIALDPNYLAPYFDLSVALEAQGKPDEAIGVLRQAADNGSNDLRGLNNLSWFLATSQSCESSDARRAVELAQKAVELAPQEPAFWNTLGAAQYRAGNWQGAIGALEKSMALHGGGNSFDWFFLAMACWQLGERDKGRAWHERAVQWAEQNAPNDKELCRFRAQAAELIQRKENAQSETRTGPR